MGTSMAHGEPGSFNLDVALGLKFEPDENQLADTPHVLLTCRLPSQVSYLFQLYATAYREADG